MPPPRGRYLTRRRATSEPDLREIFQRERTSKVEFTLSLQHAVVHRWISALRRVPDRTRLASEGTSPTAHQLLPSGTREGSGGPQRTSMGPPPYGLVTIACSQ